MVDASHPNLPHTELTSAISTWIYNQITTTTGFTSPNSNLVLTSVIDRGRYKSSIHIETGGVVSVENGTRATFIAGHDITLKDGFQAKAGSTFLAKKDNVALKKCVVVNDLPQLNSANANSRQANNHDEITADTLLIDGVEIRLIKSKTNVLDITNYIEGEDLEIVTYPNPTFDNIYIEHAYEVDKVIVTDIRGKPLQNISHTKINKIHSIDLSGISPGVYFFIIHKGSKTIYKKIVKVE